MTKEQHYIFRIKDSTPESMPLKKLLDYYKRIEQVFSDVGLHLIKISEGSHVGTLRVDNGNEHRIKERCEEIESGTAPDKAKRGFDEINEMLKKDSTTAEFSACNGADRKLIDFPGKILDSRDVQIRDMMTFVGELYYIASDLSNEDRVNVRIKTGDSGKVRCTTKRKIANGLRGLLFEKVKVSGHGTWIRKELKPWHISDFEINNFTHIKSENLRQSIDSIRSLGINWPEDVLSDLRVLNEEEK